MLTEKQRAALTAAAKEQGVNPVDLIEEAEALSGDGGKPAEPDKPGTSSSGEPPKLFMYHLPFVRVREVRQVWLGLTESFPGDDEIASEWAAKHGADAAPPEPEAS